MSEPEQDTSSNQPLNSLGTDKRNLPCNRKSGGKNEVSTKARVMAGTLNLPSQ